MHPIKAIRNQYVGVNAHLHSLWQARGGWHEFHTAHIVDLMRQMQHQLLPAGYSAAIEQSLQIRRDDELLGAPESDISIHDTRANRPPAAPAFEAAAGATVTPIAETLEIMQERAEYRALAIYRLEEGRRGQVVAWIELLSPSNKPPRSDYGDYVVKRRELVRSGLIFVEIDYLNATRPTFNHLRDGKPYRIIIIEPRPDYVSGHIYNYPFGVDDPIPTLKIPLMGNDVLSFDFGQCYNKTIEETLWAYQLIDYSQPPVHLDQYQPQDQLRIMARMQALARAARAGVDLEASAPLPTDEPL